MGTNTEEDGELTRAVRTWVFTLALEVLEHHGGRGTRGGHREAPET